MSHHVIMEKIKQVEEKNHQLLEISRRIAENKTILSSHGSHSSSIYQIEEQLKKSFNSLICSIQQFFIQIDTKLKEIIQHLPALSSFKTTVDQAHKKQHVLKSGTSLQRVHQKINFLQRDLEETKHNEKRLMEMIVKIVGKFSLTQQTTFLKDDPHLWKIISHIHQQVEQPKLLPLNYTSTQGSITVNHPLQFRSVMVNSSFPEEKNGLKLVKSVQKLHRTPLHPSQTHPRICQSKHISDMRSSYQDVNNAQDAERTQSSLDKRSYLNFNSEKKQLKLLYNPAAKINHDQQYRKKMQLEGSINRANQGPYFIKKLYSKNNKSLGKVSLRNYSNPMPGWKKQKPIDQDNKNHRQAYLMNNLII